QASPTFLVAASRSTSRATLRGARDEGLRNNPVPYRRARRSSSRRADRHRVRLSEEHAMRILDLPEGATPRAWGRIHGESFRGEVKALAAIRIYLCMKMGAFRTSAQVLAAAEAHLPVLARYHAGLHDELCGIAEGAGVTPAEIVVANHYTDLRDLDPDPTRWKPAPEGGADDPGGCSVLWAE